MRIRLAIPDHLVTPEALEAALEATALANEQAVLRGEVPHAEEGIARGVKWKPEPFSDGEHFDLAEQVLGRGWGDCDDLAPWLAGSMRATGEDAGAVPRVYQSGPGRWHVVVQTSDGQILDPSKWAGMGRKKSVSGDCALGVCGRIAKPFARPGTGGIAIMNRNGYGWARCDIPYPDSDVHLASISRAKNIDAAIDRAVSGAVACGHALGADVDRTIVAGSILLGDPEEVGFIPLAMAASPQAQSLAKGLLSKAFSKGGGEAFKRMRDEVLRKALKKRGATDEQIASMMKSKKYRPPDPAQGETIPLEADRGDSSQHMLLHYWPLNAQGPVIMRY